MQHVERRRLHRPVDLAPGDFGLARRLADHELVVRRTAGVLPGFARQGTAGRNHGFVAADGLFVERRHGEVPSDAIGFDTVALESPRALDASTHSATPNTCRGSNIHEKHKLYVKL